MKIYISLTYNARITPCITIPPVPRPIHNTSVFQHLVSVIGTVQKVKKIVEQK